MTDKEQIRQRLWDSLEMQAVIRYLVIALILAVFCILLGMRELRYLESGIRILGTAVITAISALPLLIFCIVRTVRIFWKPESYHFCKTTLCNPKGGNIRDTIKFTVLLEDADGDKFAADTHSIFHTHGGFLAPSLEDYVNKTVTAAYNEETGMVVVIG